MIRREELPYMAVSIMLPLFLFIAAAAFVDAPPRSREPCPDCADDISRGEWRPAGDPD